MTPEEYQRLASRTECSQQRALQRMCMVGSIPTVPCDNDNPGFTAIRLNHSVIGLCGEVGELAALMQKWIYYGQHFDYTKFTEELGDVLWYVAQACNALDVDMGEMLMEANIRKLKARYPDKFTEEAASNRDLAAEAQAMCYEPRKVKTVKPEAEPMRVIHDVSEGVEPTIQQNYIRSVRSQGERIRSVSTEPVPPTDMMRAVQKVCDSVVSHGHTQPAEPHPSHLWGDLSTGEWTRCQQCGVNRSLGAATQPCLGHGMYEQDGHGFGHRVVEGGGET